MTRSAIEELVHTYCDAVIHRDASRWADCWAPDATWVLTRGRTAEGRDAIAEVWVKAMAEYDVVIQHAHTATLSLGDERGTGEWHISEHNRKMDGTVGILLATYDDAYVRLQGRWLFARRALRVHYQGPPDLSGPWAGSRPEVAG